jgi:hypothetical protein
MTIASNGRVGKDDDRCFSFVSLNCENVCLFRRHRPKLECQAQAQNEQVFLFLPALTCYFFGVAQGFASQDSLLQTAMPMPAMAQMNMALQQPVMYAQAVPVKGVSRLTAGNVCI